MSAVSSCLPRKILRGITELKGKSVGVKTAQPDLLTLMAAQVGLNAAKDIHWVTDRKVKPLELFAEGKIDAFLGFAPEPQELRARHAGHVIATTTLDRPWSQYFCCMLTGNREFVRNHAVATKQVVRAVLKATDLCATAYPGRANHCRSPPRRSLRLRAADAERGSLRQMARIRRRRYRSVLRAVAA